TGIVCIDEFDHLTGIVGHRKCPMRLQPARGEPELTVMGIHVGGPREERLVPARTSLRVSRRHQHTEHCFAPHILALYGVSLRVSCVTLESAGSLNNEVNGSKV